MLQTVAKYLKKSLRTSDCISRIGGDEFAVIISSVKNISEVEAVLKKIKNIEHETVLVGKETIKITFSIGATLFPNTYPNSSLFKQADLALYYSKEHGRNQFKLHDETIVNNERYETQLKAEFKKILQNNELSVAFQPIKNLIEDKIIALEALARWKNSKLGRLSLKNL